MRTLSRRSCVVVVFFLSIASVILWHVMTVRGREEGNDETDLALDLVLSRFTRTLTCVHSMQEKNIYLKDASYNIITHNCVVVCCNICGREVEGFLFLD